MGAGARWRSKLGTIFAAIYAVTFAAVYVDYLPHRGTWLADLGLNVMAIPYVMVGRLITLDGTFELDGSRPWSLAGALVFCTALAYMVGLAVESLVRRIKIR